MQLEAISSPCMACHCSFQPYANHILAWELCLVWCFLVCFCGSCILASRFLKSGLSDRFFFRVVLCLFWGWEDPGKAQVPQPLASICFNVLYVIPVGWPEMWVTECFLKQLLLGSKAGSHLYPCCYPEWPQASSCGREIKLKFSNILKMKLIAWPQKRAAISLAHKAIKVVFPQQILGLTDAGIQSELETPVPCFSSACPQLCVVALSPAAVEKRGWRPNLQPSGRALLGKEKGVNRTGFSSTLDVRSIYHLTKDRSCWNGFIFHLGANEVCWAREVP